MIGSSASPHWEEQAFVTVAEAAQITDQSRTWVRSQLMSQALIKHQLPNRREVWVCTKSIKRLLQRRSRHRPVPRLRLVIDNTK